MPRAVACYIASAIGVLALGTSPQLSAGDGDVDYSAPYITVDPETGELVTVNPGPKLKNHPAPSSAGSGQLDAADATPESTAHVSGPASSSAAESDSDGLPTVTLAVLVGLAVFSAVVISRRSDRKTEEA